jgi:enoyl-CoA hydratase/carnithine racemase
VADYEQIVVERDPPVTLVWLNRPDRQNAWTWVMSRELNQAFNEADGDDDGRAVVVTGKGKQFCAGADLGSGGDTFSGRGTATGSRDDQEAALSRKPASKLATPIIAAINGGCVGAGLTMPLEWDIRIAADDAKLGFVFNRRGVMPDADLIWWVPRLVGFSRAMDLLLTARIFSGREAAEWGLVSRAVPRDRVVDTALEMARDIATNVAPVSAAITKRLMYRYIAQTDRRAALTEQSRFFNWTGRQEDAREGIMAFLERRDPKWNLSKTKDFPEDLFERQ